MIPLFRIDFQEQNLLMRPSAPGRSSWRPLRVPVALCRTALALVGLEDLSAQHPRIIGVTQGAEAGQPVLAITFQSMPLAAGEFFFVEDSTNLGAWASIDNPGISDLGGSTFLLNVPHAGRARAFVRIRTAPLFLDVTSTHLPEGLTGLSMDANTADLDGDGDIDIAIANEFQPNFLLLNNGDGTFVKAGPGRIPQANHDSEDVAIADFDKDGDSDIVVVTEDDFVNEYYLNDGNGFFSDAGNRIPVTGRSNAVVCGDIDGDGDDDLIIGNNGQNHLLINDGAGFFADGTALRLPLRSDVTQDIELGDVDGDGDLDLIVANEGLNHLLLNNGAGFFSDAPAGALPASILDETREADFGDVDGDGDLDILFANTILFTAHDPQNRLFVNDGSGVFTDETASRLPVDADKTFDGDFIDIDRDGDLDILTANLDSTGAAAANAPYRVYLNDGEGVFLLKTETIYPSGVVGNGLDIEAADFNGDGWPDLYLSSRWGTDRLLLQRR